MPDTDALAKRLARWQREQADMLETECDAGGSLHDVEHMRATADELDRLAAALSAARAEIERLETKLEAQKMGEFLRSNVVRAEALEEAEKIADEYRHAVREGVSIHPLAAFEIAKRIRALAAGQGGESAPEQRCGN